ncbi:MAG: hypothetical protein JKX76_00645 [Colwellia sp.]|nr:hypothetical protein [Colwellia sp.]
MKLLKIVPVEKPKSFVDAKFSQRDWEAANKLGAQTVPAVTAVEAIRNSKGLYVIKNEEQETVKVEFKGIKDPGDMDASELVAEMTAHGKPPKKNMKRQTAVEFVKVLREKAAAFIIDE